MNRAVAWGSTKTGSAFLATDGYMVGSAFGFNKTTALNETYTGSTDGNALVSEDLPAGWPLVDSPASEPVVSVRPTARGASLTFRLDDIGLYSPASYGAWIQPGEAKLEWTTVDDASWSTPRRGQDFVRVQASRVSALEAVGPTPDPRMATMLFGLEPATTYRYRVTLTGGDYAIGTPVVSGEFTTLREEAAVTGTTQVVTIGPTTTSSQLNSAVAAAFGTSGVAHVQIQSTEGLGARTVVRAKLGTVSTRQGTTDAWKRLSVRRDGSGNPDVVFDGSLASYDTTGGSNWSPFTDAARNIEAVDGIYVSADTLPYASRIFYVPTGAEYGVALVNVSGAWVRPDPTPPAVAWPDQDAQRWDRLDSPSSGIELKDGTTDPTLVVRAGLNQSAFTFVHEYSVNIGTTTSPYMVDYGRYYVRLQDGIDPDTVRMKIPAPAVSANTDVFTWIYNCKFVQFDGFDIGYYKGGLSTQNVDDLIFRDNSIHNTGQWLLGSYRFNRIVIANSTFLERGTSPDFFDSDIVWPEWGQVKFSTNERSGLKHRGTSVSIVDNEIFGNFNGVDMSSTDFVWTGTTNNETNNRYAEAVEIDNNVFWAASDDAIEPEGYALNIAVTRNRFDATYKGLSVAPTQGGPVHVLRNEWVGRGIYDQNPNVGGVPPEETFLKLGRSDIPSTAYHNIAHNTIHNVNAQTDEWALTAWANAGHASNLWIYNNYVDVDNGYINFASGGLGYPRIFDYNRIRLRRHSAVVTAGNVTGDNIFAVATHASLQGELTPNRRYSQGRTGFVQWQKGLPALGSAIPGAAALEGATPTAHVTADTPGNPSGGPAQPVTWFHDTHSTYAGSDDAGWDSTPEVPIPAGYPFTAGLAPVSVTGWPVARVLYGVNTDLGPGWASYAESTVTVGAVPYTTTGNQSPVLTIPSYRARAGSDIVATLTATDTDGTIASIGTASVTGPAGAVAFVLGSPVGLGTATATVTVTFTALAPGAYTVQATATDDAAATDTTSGISHARRPVSTVVVAG